MSSSNSPCAACKLLRRKCTQGCVFAPYFPPDQPTKFAYVHRVFGASNIAKLLNDLSPAQREDAVNSLAYEAQARLNDPVHGCVGYIYLLQHKLEQVQSDLNNAKKELATYVGPAALGPFLPHPRHHPLAVSQYPYHQYGHNLQGASGSSVAPYGVGVGMGLGLASPTAIQHPQILMSEQQDNVQLIARDQELLQLGRFGDGNFSVDGSDASFGQIAGGNSGGQSLVPAQNIDGALVVQQQQQYLQSVNDQHSLQVQHHRVKSDDEGRSGL